MNRSNVYESRSVHYSGLQSISFSEKMSLIRLRSFIWLSNKQQYASVKWALCEWKTHNHAPCKKGLLSVCIVQTQKTISLWRGSIFTQFWLTIIYKLLSFFLPISFSEASRRFMMRTCNGLGLRDHIPPLPPEVAFSNFDSSLLLDHHILNICER